MSDPGRKDDSISDLLDLDDDSIEEVEVDEDEFGDFEEFEDFDDTPDEVVSDAEIEEDDFQSDLEPENTYTVQRPFSVSGRTYMPGDVIEVLCRHCTLWKREWLGRVRCAPGHILEDGTVMAADRFSCGSFFVPKDLEMEFNTFLRMTVPEAQLIRRMLPGSKKLIDAEIWFDGWADRYGITSDREAITRTARSFIFEFTSVEQVNYVWPFVRFYTARLTKQERDRMSKRVKIKFEAGDWVEWIDFSSQDLFNGIILTIHRGNINIAGINRQAGMKFTYKYRDWKRDHGPKLLQPAPSEGNGAD